MTMDFVYEYLFSFYLLSLEVHLLATDVDWLLLIESVMCQMRTTTKLNVDLS